MADLRVLLVEASGDDPASPVGKLAVNDGLLVEPGECGWIAARLRAVDRDLIM